MRTSGATLYSNEQFADTIGTATGAVSSPKPSIRAQFVVHVLRSRVAVSQAWLSQAQNMRVIGSVIGYPRDGASSVTLENCAITNIDPDTYDGSDPTMVITIDGSLPNPTYW